MILRNILEFEFKKNKRDIYQKVLEFINSKDCYDGRILVLFGILRTGKTTIMEQIIQEYSKKEKCVFYEVQKNDDMDIIYKTIIEEKNKGVKLICIDEITKAYDFIDNSSILPDVFAKEGIRIIVTGTDSLSFSFASRYELFDRMEWINTTHISFTEHCRVLNINDIDDYIKYGGLMSKSKKFVIDYDSACKYLDSAVSRNIANSINKNPQDTPLKELTIKEISSIIEKMVEIYSGQFNKSEMKNELKKATINYPINKLRNKPYIINSKIIDNLIYEKKNITKDFVKNINADLEIKHEITNEIVRDFESYLEDLNVLSSIKKVIFRKNNDNWEEYSTIHEYYIVQPAIKYFHLRKGIEFIENEEYYKNLSNIQKDFIIQIFDNKIKGDMMKQIIIFDTKFLLEKNYDILKPEFYTEAKIIGEYDMLIYDKRENVHWGFEIEHTSTPYSQQYKHIKNKDFQDIMQEKYGKMENICVLYRGNSFITSSEVVYFNITNFMLSLEEYKDVQKVFSVLTEGLDIINLEENEKKEENILV